jgi:integrase
MIESMRRHLSGGPNPLRNEAMLILGVNSGLRVSDLLGLAVGQVVDERGRFRQSVELVEAKTGKTRRFPVNEAAREALGPHLADLAARGAAGPGDALFPASRSGAPLSRKMAHLIMSSAGLAVGLADIGTHSLRKTFGYHLYKRTGGNLALVQKMLNHSNSGDTLRYIGVDREQMDDACLDLNLGLRKRPRRR